MIPAGEDGAVRIGGLVLREHRAHVPLDHARPDGEQIEVFAREAVAADRAGDDLPWLLFLQGGPGGAANRPEGRSGWLDRAVKDFRVLLLDQRGTGRSTPVTAAALARRGSPEAQADYLALFRADAIVRDAEALRESLGIRSWHLLGQSFGGFCVFTYLSFHGGSLDAAYVTGGVPPVGVLAEDVYRATFPRVVAKNAAFHRAFPGDRERLEELAALARSGGLRLLDGSPVSVRWLQTLGGSLGGRGSAIDLHWLLEQPLIDGEPSAPFLEGLGATLSHASRPLYALLHEAIYAEGVPTRWAAERVRAELPELADDAVPLLLTGEAVHPWLLDEDPALRPFRDVGHLLAERDDWPALYDLDALAANEVPVAAAVYHDDMYVDAGLSLRTAAHTGAVRTWVTDEHDHDGLRQSTDVLDRLVRMARGEV